MLSNYRYRGRHRAPSTTGQTCAKVAAAGVVAALPAAVAPAAHAGPAGGWGPIIQCESGGNPTIENPSPRSTASGLFQFTDPTWRSVGGIGRAKDASVEEQHRRAEMLYTQRGTQPWNASKPCWAGKTVAEPARSAPQSAPVRGAPARSAAGDTHAVERGETLSRIARDHGSTWQKVHAVNRAVIGADPDRIFPGQRLVIP
jgi:LysM repeat protein